MTALFRLGPPSPSEIEDLLATARNSDLSYSPIGLSNVPSPPPRGFHEANGIEVIGHGDGAFERAAAGLREWAAHRGAGFDVWPAGAELDVGSVVLVVMPAGPLTVLGACRVVTFVDRPDRFGFAYGTLPLHPEAGEESFLVTKEPGGAVRFAVRAVSRHRHWLVRLGGPLSGFTQRRALGGYIAGLHSFVSGDS